MGMATRLDEIRRMERDWDSDKMRKRRWQAQTILEGTAAQKEQMERDIRGTQAERSSQEMALEKMRQDRAMEQERTRGEYGLLGHKITGEYGMKETGMREEGANKRNAAVYGPGSIAERNLQFQTGPEFEQKKAATEAQQALEQQKLEQENIQGTPLNYYEKDADGNWRIAGQTLQLYSRKTGQTVTPGQEGGWEGGSAGPGGGAMEGWMRKFESLPAEEQKRQYRSLPTEYKQAIQTRLLGTGGGTPAPARPAPTQEAAPSPAAPANQSAAQFFGIDPNTPITADYKPPQTAVPATRPAGGGLLNYGATPAAASTGPMTNVPMDPATPAAPTPFFRNPNVATSPMGLTGGGRTPSISQGLKAISGNPNWGANYPQVKPFNPRQRRLDQVFPKKEWGFWR